MARITVEDCIDKFPRRFELVLVASNRARKLFSGETPTVDKDNDKNTVIALREIAQETLSKEQLKNDLIEEYQTTSFSEDEDLNEEDENIQQDENMENILEDNSNNDTSINTDDTHQHLSEEINDSETEEVLKEKEEADVDNEDIDTTQDKTII